MELLVLLSLCLLTFTGKTFGDDSIKITIKEDEDIILNCSFGTDITGHRIEWKKYDKDVFHFDFGKEDLTVQDPFKDRVSRFSEDLKSGDVSVKIQGAKVSDSGNYTCLYNQAGQAPVDQRLIELTVECILKDRTKDPERKQVACRKPNIRTTKVKDGVQVNCTARGVSLKSKMELKNKTGDTVYAKDPTDDDITLLTVVTKEDHYYCVLTQEEICHQAKTEEVHVSSGSGYLLIILIIIIVLLFIAVLVISIFFWLYVRKHSGGQNEWAEQGHETQGLKDLMARQPDMSQ